MKILNLFPTPVLSILLKDISDFLIKEYIEECSKIKYINEGATGFTSNNQQVLNISAFKILKKNILNYASLYLKEMSHEFEELQISNSWVNLLNQHQSIPPHKHYNSYISGVFYLTNGSPINFFHPSSFSENNIKPNYLDSPTFYPVEEKITTQKGLLLIFPSYLEHSVYASDIDGRISIAFNIIPKGEFGPPTAKLYLK